MLKTGTELHIPIHIKLWASIKATPAKGVTLVGDASGRPIGAGGLSRLIKRAVKKAGLPKRCVPHGLRNALSRRLAECGASSKEIAAVTGHKTLKEVERYTASADQRRLSEAAFAKLEDRTEGE